MTLPSHHLARPRIHYNYFRDYERAPSARGFKYRLAYVVGGKCVVLYDNERGKGDHRHFGKSEKPYRFASPDRLVADFGADIERWNRENGRP